jgi:hypothetical protein
LRPIGTPASVLDSHLGAVRSFELGGTSTTTGRRWAARCSCGVVATTGAWPEAIAYLSEHRRATPELRAAWVSSRPTPDLRGVEYRRIDVIGRNGDAHRPRVPVMRQLVAGVLHTVVRAAVGFHSFMASG